ncbi:MAG: LysM peptidoglycan-binding domain-containing protein [bacterium]
MKKMLILMVFVALFAQETTHVVKIDDTLWDIADIYYQNPFLWPYVWRANLTKIEDPHWIYPEQLFVIPPNPEGEVTEYVPEHIMYSPPPTKKTAEVISFVEADKRIFSEEIIHRAGFILEEDIPLWGKIVGTEPSGEKLITSYKKVYIDRTEDINIGDVLTVYRPGMTIKHPKTGDFLGKEVIVLGRVEIEDIGEEGSRAKVIASYDIIKKGDFVIPYEPILAPIEIEMVATEDEIEGYVVEVKDDGLVTEPHVFVYIDHGEETGTAVGDLFDVYQERTVAGKLMPDFNIAKIQVISVFQKASIGLLLNVRETVMVKRGERIRLAMEAR